MTESNALPKFPESYWMDSVHGMTSFPKLSQSIDTEAVVVGGGITGITTAYLLARAGLKVVLLEADKLLHGTTGHTTAKITSQHDLIYDMLIKKAGKEKAALYYQANRDAMQFILHTIEQYDMDCGLSVEDAYVFTNSVDYIPDLESEMNAYSALGIEGEFVDSIPLSIPAKAAVRMNKQAQFHPLRYLSTLIREIVKEGVDIYEGTTAVDVQKGSLPQVVTSEGHTVTCKYVVSCSHFPFYDGGGFYFAKMYAERSYVLGIKTEAEFPGGMYISAEEPKRSIRSAAMEDGSKLLLIGGQSHKTGQGICTINHYEMLGQYAVRHFQLQEIAYRWSAQDLITGDDMPYIGRITESSPNIFVATGYKKWGMTSGTAAAMLISDLIMGRQNPYEQLFAPSRSMSLGTLKNLAVENADVAKHLIAGKLGMTYRTMEELGEDEGAIVRVQGRRAGAYKDSDGKLHLVDTTCTHMGCEVEWNDGDRTWDCPCHGSRFSISGEVIEGPADKPLKTIASQ
ncbi:FAD-dependent oxidoreductase [Paenibacillus chungangensis]|uniref:FAD-dependent oxidoreductase n=1 Tax=Paenibacillus chungangensis TaxID=696535 RepID=A0ABW3HQI7_9BACL